MTAAVIAGAIAVAALGLYCQVVVETRRQYRKRHGRKRWVGPDETSF